MGKALCMCCCLFVVSVVLLLSISQATSLLSNQSADRDHQQQPLMRTLVARLVLLLATSTLTHSIGLEQDDVVSLSTSSDGFSDLDSAPPVKIDIPPVRQDKKQETHAPRQVKMLLSKGKEYYGFVVDKDMHGKGTLKYADGTMYEGDFVHNKRHGRGRIRYASGEEYRGEWFNGFMTGKGTYNFQDGSVYTVRCRVW